MKDSLVKGVNTLTEDLAKPSDIEITDISNQEIAADIVLRKYIKPPPEISPVVPRKTTAGTIPVDYYDKIAAFWKDAKTWAVGEEFDNVSARLQKGYGKSLVNRAIQYHTDLQSGVNFEWAMGEDLPDSGVLELVLEDIAEFGGNLPGYVPGAISFAAITGFITRNPLLTHAAALYGAGFVTDSLNATYLEGLERKLVGDPVDFAALYANIGIQEGHKGGKKVLKIFGPSKLVQGVRKGGTAVGEEAYKLLGRKGQKIIDTINRYPTTRDYFSHILISSAMMAKEVGGAKNINARDWQRMALNFAFLDYGFPASQKTVNKAVRYSLEKGMTPRQTIIDIFSDTRKKYEFFKTVLPQRQPVKSIKKFFKPPERPSAPQLIEETTKATRNPGKIPTELNIVEEANIAINDFLGYPQKIYNRHREYQSTVNWSGKDGKITWESVSKKFKDLWDKDDAQLLSPIENLRVIPQAENKAKAYLEDGIPDIVSGKIISPSFQSIKKGLERNKIPVDTYSEYMINANLLGMHSNRKKFDIKKFSVKTIEQITKEQKNIEKEFGQDKFNYPIIKRFANDYYLMQKALLKMRYDSGILTKKQYDTYLKNIDKEQYVTRKHLEEKTDSQGNRIYEPLPGQTDVFRARKGSTRPIQNILLTMYEQIYQTTQAAEYNIGHNKWFEFITEAKKKHPRAFEEWKLLKTGPDKTDKTIKVKRIPEIKMKSEVIVSDKKMQDLLTGLDFPDWTTAGTTTGTVVGIKNNKITVRFADKSGKTEEATFNRKDIKPKSKEKTKTEEIPNYEQYKDMQLNEDGIVISYQNRGNTIRFSKGGISQTWAVPKEMRKAIDGFNSVEMGTAMKFMKLAADTLKFTATGNPVFWTWTFFRDSFMLPLVTKVPSVRTSVPFLNIAWGMFDQISPHLKLGRKTVEDAMLKKFKSTGAGLTIIETAINDYKNQVKYFERFGPETRNYVNSLNKEGIIELGINSEPIIRAMTRTGMTFENAGRYQEFVTTYKKLKKKFPKASEREILEASGYAARDIINYSKYGSKVQNYNRMSAFMIPAIRGFEKVIHRTVENPVKSITAALLTQLIPAWVNHNQNINDPDYIRDWSENPDKAGQLNYIMPVKWTLGLPEGEYIWFKAYRPWGGGVWWGRQTEVIMDAIHDEDPMGYAAWVWSSMTQTVKGLALLGVPTAVRPTLELATGWNLFRDGEVVPGSYEKFVEDYDYFPERVSELSKTVASLTNQNAFNVDHMIKGHVPGLGTMLLKALDKEIRETMGSEYEDPLLKALGKGSWVVSDEDSIAPPYAYGKHFLQNIDTYPLIGYFFEKKGPKHNAAIQTRFWDLHNELEKIYTTANKYKDADKKRYRKFLKEKKWRGRTNKDAIIMYHKLRGGRTGKVMDKITNDYKVIFRCKYIHDNKKKFLKKIKEGEIRECIDKAYERINKLMHKRLYKIGEVRVDADEQELKKVMSPTNRKKTDAGNPLLKGKSYIEGEIE